jgi:outer membrane lipoprotein carrier protein
VIPQLILWFLLASQSPDDPSVYAKRFERTYRQKHSLKVTFLETYTDNGRVSRKEAGVAYFLRPGKMRWEYAAPEKNLFIVDGKNAWFYVPEDHTVTKVPARQSDDWRTSFALLARNMKLSRLCKRVEFAEQERPQRGENVVLSCVVRESDSSPAGSSAKSKTSEPPAETSTALLEVDRNSGELVRVIFHDPGGIEIQFQFSGWSFDQPMDPALFRFVPPLGVAIVEGYAAQPRP